MLKRSPRVGLLGVAIAAALAGCGQDPQLTTYQQRIYDQGIELDEGTSRSASRAPRPTNSPGECKTAG